MRGFPKTATIASGEFIINLRQTRDVSAYIDSWRDQLVDLTKKNSLLNFKPGKTTSLPISVPTGHKVIGLLLNGLSVPISFLRIETKPTSPIEETTDTKPSWELRTNFNSGLVYADFIESDLKTRLTNLTRRTNQEFLDRGLWTLYLAYGQLNWRDIDNEEYKSPLLLLPIKIEYATEVNGFVMTRTEDDIVVNPALLIKSEKLGITIPMPNLDVEGFSGNEWLADINESLSNTEGWAASDLAVISRFSFFKEAMYKDLLENVQKISENPIVLAIVDPENYPLVGGDLVLADEVDEVAPPEKIPLVLDSDSSQRAAIATALKGSSLVIDGPPGTGKSQTITNLIGAFLNEGKTVLFVSEKSAALDVVKNRLAAAGLDSYILEIHSHKATRKDVASELGRALIYKPTPPRGLSESEIGRAAALRELLAQASEASNKIRPPFGKSFNDVVGAVAQLHTYPDVTPSQKFQGDFSIEKLSEIRSIGQRATKFWRPALEGQKFLWRGVKNETSKTELLSNLKNRVKDLESALFPYSDWVHNFQWEIQRLPSLLQFITFAEVNHAHLDEEWLTSPDLALQRSQFALLEESTSVIKEFQRDVDEIYSLDKTFFTKTFSIELKNNPINLDDWAALTLRELGQSKRELDIFSKALSKVIPLADQIDLELELKLATGISPLRVRHDLLNVVTSEFKPKFSWIRGSGLKEVESEFLKLKEAFDRMGQYQ